MAEKNKLEIKTKFQDIEVAVNERMKNNFDQLTKRVKNYSSNQFEYKDNCIEGSLQELICQHNSSENSTH